MPAAGNSLDSRNANRYILPLVFVLLAADFDARLQDFNNNVRLWYKPQLYIAIHMYNQSRIIIIIEHASR